MADGGGLVVWWCPLCGEIAGSKTGFQAQTDESHWHRPEQVPVIPASAVEGLVKVGNALLPYASHFNCRAAYDSVAECTCGYADAAARWYEAQSPARLPCPPHPERTE